MSLLSKLKNKEIKKDELSLISRKLYSANTLMTTDYNRTDDIDAEIHNIFKKAGKTEMIGVDIGVSFGVNAFQFLDNNLQFFKKYELMDRQLYFYQLEFSNLNLILNSHKELVCVEFNDEILRYRYYLIAKYIIKFFKKLINLRNLNRFSTLSKDDIKYKTIIVTEACIKKYVFKNNYDFIRCNNLLNYAYFNKNELKKIIYKLKQCLKDGGYLAVNRTESNGKNNGSIFKKRDNRLIEVAKLNSGTELLSLIESEY